MNYQRDLIFLHLPGALNGVMGTVLMLLGPAEQQPLPECCSPGNSWAASTYPLPSCFCSCTILAKICKLFGSLLRYTASHSICPEAAKPLLIWERLATANSSCQRLISDKTWPKMSRLDQVSWSSRAALTGPLPVVFRKQRLLKLRFPKLISSK